jgi:hypothetical protein
MKKISLIACLLFTILTSKYAVSQQTDTVKVATISIKGISCKMDLPIIKKQLINQEGIDEVTYSEPISGEVYFTLTYHTAFITESIIKKAIETAPSCDNPGELPYRVKSFNNQIDKR